MLIWTNMATQKHPGLQASLSSYWNRRILHRGPLAAWAPTGGHQISHWAWQACFRLAFGACATGPIRSGYTASRWAVVKDKANIRRGDFWII